MATTEAERCKALERSRAQLEKWIHIESYPTVFQFIEAYVQRSSYVAAHTLISNRYGHTVAFVCKSVLVIKGARHHDEKCLQCAVAFLPQMLWTGDISKKRMVRK